MKFPKTLRRDPTAGKVFRVDASEDGRRLLTSCIMPLGHLAFPAVNGGLTPEAMEKMVSEPSLTEKIEEGKLWVEFRQREKPWPKAGMVSELVVTEKGIEAVIDVERTPGGDALWNSVKPPTVEEVNGEPVTISQSSSKFALSLSCGMRQSERVDSRWIRIKRWFTERIFRKPYQEVVAVEDAVFHSLSVVSLQSLPSDPPLPKRWWKRGAK